MHLRSEDTFQTGPEAVSESGHQGTHADSARQKISKWKTGLDAFYMERWKLTFEGPAVADKDHPRKRHVRSRERTGGNKGPIRGVGLKGFVMESRIDETRPPSDPWLDHENFSAWTKAPNGFSKEPTYIGHVMEDIGHDNRAQRLVSERKAPSVEGETNPCARKNF